MKLLPRLLALSLALAPCLLPIRAQAAGWPNHNDSIFPAEAAAKPYINFDGKGFLINGKRTYIVAGELQYPRTPRAMWRDRLLRIKRAGYNTIQTYAFWNYHEPREGQFDFTGEKDFDAFLKLVHSLHMYAIVRMGPYVNAEWDTGGLPVWLRFKPGLRAMSDNGPFYQAVTPYLDKLFPILAANQINHGGPILMVQLENEHVISGGPDGPGGGTDLPNAYYHWYYDKARKMGLEVPLFFSGLNHNDDPAGDSPLDISGRTSPWYSTEFWTGWVGRYGMDADRAKKLERTTWKVIAYGGAGYTHYTMAGGTDFDTWNNDQQASSYDFGSPIGQVGDLRDAYYRCKRAALFATSFAPVLSNSLSASGGDGTNTTENGIQITNRKGAAGEVLFLDNANGGSAKTRIKTADGKTYPSAGSLTLEPGEIMPVVKGFPLAPGVNLQLAATHLLGTSTEGTMTTLVAFGTPGDAAELHFTAQDAKIVQQPTGKNALAATPGHVVWRTQITAATPTVGIFQVGKQMVRILAMSADLADRTWFLDNGLIACGPDYIGETEGTGTSPLLETERRGLTAATQRLPQLLFYPTLGQPVPLKAVIPPNAPPASATAPTLGPWGKSEAVAVAQPSYNDTAWKASEQPLPMGADGDFSAYAWYRAKVNAPSAGVYQVNISDAGDWLSCFVNGKHADSSDVQTRYKSPAPRNLRVTLKAGQNSLAFLTAHYGRNKLFNYYGPLDTIDAKGISGTVSLTTTAPQAISINNFRWQTDDQAPNDAAKFAAPTLSAAGADWHDATTATDAFNGRVGWAWFRATLPNVPGQHRRLHFNSIDDNGTVYLNGQKIADNVGVNAGADISLDSAWHEGGPNVLAVAVQNTAGAGGILGDVKLTGGLIDGIEVHGWKMRGGITPPTATSPLWQPLSGSDSLNAPSFYHAAFSATPPSAVGPYPILRATFAGLSRGFFYLNGRCLGRYPEKAPIDSIYLPESLLLPGQNSLVIFDEDGNSPSQVKLVVETNASRYGTVLAPESRETH
jgi:beta-galactosidase